MIPKNNNNTYKPKKRLGQNFLVDENVQNKIIQSCNLSDEDNVLEIGPGQGAITDKIYKKVKSVVVVEKDKELAEALAEKYKNTNITVEHFDFLKFSLKDVKPNTKVIGNLPYNVATPIIEKVLNNKSKFDSFCITIQLEHAQRLTSKPNSKNYGSLSCFIQFHAKAKILFKIGNTSFRPVPKVQSCFVHLDLTNKNLYQVKKEDQLFRIVKRAFSQRRKNITNSLSGLLGKENTLNILEKLDISPKLRAENLSLNDYIKISNSI